MLPSRPRIRRITRVRTLSSTLLRGLRTVAGATLSEMGRDPISSRRSTQLAQARERRRIIAGLLAALEHRDPRVLRTSDVIEAAGVSPRTFHAHFDDIDACFDFACEAALDTLLSPLVASRSVSRPPATRLSLALAALLGSLAARPRLAELCLLHAPARRPDGPTRLRLEDALAGLLLDLRSQPPPPSSRVGEAALARGLVGFILADLVDRPVEEVERLHPRLIALLAPVLGLEDVDTD